MRIKLNKGRLAHIAAALAAVLIFGAVAASAAVAGTAAWSVPAGEADVCAAVPGELTLIPGGMSFGVKFFTDGILIVGFSGTDRNPAYAAGLRVNDIILKLDGHTLEGAGELTETVAESGGRALTMTCRRDGHEFQVTVTPERDNNGEYKTGMWVRDSGAGIGTVTFIDPRTGAFGGLGHGICDADTGKPVPLGRGSVVGVTISGITRGTAGTPGEIKGYFEPQKLGSVIGNTDYGVYGIYQEIPAGLYPAMPVAAAREVKNGEATILCTLDTGKICEYKVEISSVDYSAAGGRCFAVHVTDPALLEITGGIIQGMSGSPVLQNGKIIGAVTHVLINDPSTGYGIFIENMLEHMPEVLK